MRSNPAAMRAQYEQAQGCKLSDEQFAQIMTNMNPETVRMG